MAFKMKKGSPMERNFGIGGPIKRKGIYETFDVDGKRQHKRISKEDAKKAMAEGKTITRTGADKELINISKKDHSEGYTSVKGEKQLAENKKILKQQKAKNVKDLETGKTISAKEDKKLQRKANLQTNKKS